MFCDLHNFGKISGAAELYLTLPTAKPLTHPCICIQIISIYVFIVSINEYRRTFEFDKVRIFLLLNANAIKSVINFSANHPLV